MNRSNTRHVVVGIGEALFDCFREESVLGGAPVNFAAHIQQLIAPLGGRSLVVSRCGADKLGNRLVDELSQRGLETGFLQRDSTALTGRVEVAVSADGEPTYTIAPDAAWDFLRYDGALDQLARQTTAVCFGTLAQRSPTSRQTINRFLSAAEHAVRIFDVNLRQSFYNRDIIDQSLSLATVLKTNEEELHTLAGLIGGPPGNATSVDDIAFEICKRYNLNLLALTRGSRGTVLFTENERAEAPVSPATRTPDADSVGAGDACCAGIVYGLLQQWPLANTLELANRMGSFVASRRGATPTLPADVLTFAAHG